MYQKEFEDYIKKEYTDNNGNLVKPYYEIDELNWTRLKEKYDKDDIKETLAEILMEYEPPYMAISLEEATDDFNKLGIHSYAKQNEYTTESRHVKTDFFTEVVDVDEKSVELNEDLDQSYLEKLTSKERHEKSKTKIIKRRLNSLFVDTPWFARSEYDWKLSNRVLKRNNTGNKASNYFQQENRWSVDGSVSPGPLRTWNNKDFMTSLMGSLFTLKAEKVNKSTLRTSIGLRKYICSQFRPNVAKQIYNFYLDSLDSEFKDNLNEVRTVLDFSMGWGDRLCGFYASKATKYIGLDPRTENHPIYNQQKEFYEKLMNRKKETVFIESPAEDADLTEHEDSVDLIFTSPPYFSVERYSYDDTQSWVRHKNIDRWNEDFLHKALNNVLTTLRSGGLLMVNISDVNASSQGTKGGKQWLKICDPMNEYLHNRGDMKYVECFGMEMAKRPNCLGIGTADDIDDSNMDAEYHEREGSFGEPVWVWQKN